MKFLITMNMPSAVGHLVHQVTVETSCTTIDEMLDMLSSNDFILGTQWYRKKTPDGMYWEDRGQIVINTTHVGKVQVFIEYGKDLSNDEAYTDTEYSRQDTSGPRGTVRGRRPML
jgi:hypothetical protein